MKELLFGTAGIPLNTEHRTTINGIKTINSLKLECMEMAFVQSVYLTEKGVEEVKETAKKYNVTLTAHAPYFINLNAKEKAKVEASKHRIYKTAKITHMAGGYSIVFHPGFYLKQDPKKVYLNILDNLQDIMQKLDDEGIDIYIRPETMGKPTSFGDLDEILKLSESHEKILPCIDFAHLHAREGKNNTTEEFRVILNKVENTLGKTGLNNMHIHLSGIHYTEKGEKYHLPLKESDMNYKDLLKVWKEYKIKGVVICESPLMEKDALLLKNTYKK
jgi:deoxyribonuclease-4